MPFPRYREPVREKDVLPKRSPPPAPTAVLDASNVGPGTVDFAFCAVPLAHSMMLPLFQLTSVSTRGTWVWLYTVPASLASPAGWNKPSENWPGRPAGVEYVICATKFG